MSNMFLVVVDKAEWDAYNIKLFQTIAETQEEAIEDIKITMQSMFPEETFESTSFEATKLSVNIDRPTLITELSGG